MSTLRMKLSDLALMPAGDKSRALTGIVRAAREGARNGSSVIDSRIRNLEVRNGMTSDELRAKLSRGEIRETAQVAEWLFLLNARHSRVAR
jgi:hypothetical protein